MNRFVPKHLALVAMAILCVIVQTISTSAASDPTVPAVNADQHIPPAPWEVSLEKAEQAVLDDNPSLSDKLCAEALAGATDDPARATIINQIGVLQMKQRRFRDARNSFLQALELRRKCLGEDKPETLKSLSNLALATHRSGKNKDAEELYRQCIEGKRKSVPNSASLAKTLTNVANLYSDERKCEDAKQLYLEALDIDTKVFGAKHQEVASDLFNLGALLYRCNQFGDALSYLDKAGTTYTTLVDKYGTVKCLHYSSLCHAGLHNYDKAAETAVYSLELHEELKGKGHPDTLVHLLNAARALDSAGSTERAEQFYKEALSAARRASPPSNFHLAECNLDMALFYRSHGNNDEAEHHFKKAIAHFEQLRKKDQRGLYEIPLAYSELLHDQKRNAESEDVAHKYLQVYAPTP